MKSIRFQTPSHHVWATPATCRCFTTRLFRVAVILGLFAMGGLRAHADRYVDQQNTTPAYPYDSWGNAAVHIQQAVDAAAENDTVWIRAGTYTLPPSATNYWGTNVVYFSQPLTLRSETDNPADVIIDGEGVNRPIAAVNTADGLDSGTNPDAIITDPFIVRGITVTNGYAVNRGGGILFYAALAAWPAHVINCVVTDNTVVWGESATTGGNLGNGAYGGGICAHGSYRGSDFFMTNTIVRNNLAVRFPDTETQLETNGGGLYIENSGNKQIVGSRIENNRGHYGGGARLNRVPGKTIVDSTIFIGNNATLPPYGTGGALNLGGGGPYGRSIVRNSLFHDNTAQHFGGAIGLTYQNNTNTPLPLIANCTIVNNQSSNSRGAIGVRFATYQDGAGIVLANSILLGNTGQDINFELSPDTTLEEAVANSAFTNNITSALSGGVPFPGPGNITEAPTYVDAAANNYRLVRDSRGVNEGFNLDASLMGTKDLDGNRRIDGRTGIVDIGAYEYVYGGTLLLVR